jgi:hypothetical protein
MVTKIPRAKDPEFLFYYVGHGNKLNGMVFGKKGQKAEIMNYGTRGPLIKPDDGTVITDTLAGNLLSIPSKDITVIIDSCKSGTAIEALSNVGLKGQILTATNEDGLALGWRFCRMDYTSYLLDGRKKHGSFWLGHDHAVYKGKHYWWYKDPEPQKKKLEGKFHRNVIVEGRVTDKESGKAISRATIKIKGTRVQGTEEKTCTTTTDKDGKYRIELPWWGTFNFKVEALGYEPSECKMGMDGGASLDFKLPPKEKPSTPTPTPISTEMPGVAVEADTTTTVELDTVTLIVTGVADDEIKVESSPLSEHVLFQEGMDDIPAGADFHGNWFTDTIDKDGIRKYAVKFDDTGSYTIEVTVTDSAEPTRVGDYDTVDITVLLEPVALDFPSIVGDKITIRGTATSGNRSRYERTRLSEAKGMDRL